MREPRWPRGTGLMMAVAVAVALTLSCTPEAPEPTTSSSSVTNRLINPEQANLLAALESRERTIADTLWTPEILAQRRGRTFDALWDAILASTHRLAVLRDFTFDELALPVWGAWEPQVHGVQIARPSGPGPRLTLPEWGAKVDPWIQSGWQLGAIEFRHYRFEPGRAGQPDRSEFYVAAELLKDLAGSRERWVIEGDLGVVWKDDEPGAPVSSLQRLDASRLVLKKRQGNPPFRLVQSEVVTPPENSHSIDPLILHDLNGDGSPEIILAARNLVYRRQPNGRYQPDALWGHPPGLISSAVIGDFDGDAADDFVVAKHEGLVLLRGTAGGEFPTAEIMAWPAPAELRHVSTMTVGDVEGDGDLDLFVAQYRVPYENGAMPTPYYDANDGYPAFLLMNDGHGRFSDGTVQAGLAAKRFRRTYSASLVDLDRDRKADLVVVSDFAGTDLYRNLGDGRFAEMTGEGIPVSRGFGMAHSLADFNADGRLDLMMMGMSSPTACRLEHLALWRESSPETRAMRSAMIHGNRLLISRLSGGFDERSAEWGVANSGWSWGCTSPDFDNDGYPDLYVANGLESRKSVEDYESQFWLHDVFIGGSAEDSTSYLYFMSKFNRTRGRGQSYGGYERNRLYLNRQGRSFLEVGGVFGLGFQEDARNVVAEDLDGDGRMDLVVTSFEPWPRREQTLRLYQSELPDTGRWIGVHLRASRAVTSVIGTEVRLRYGTGQNSVRSVVGGDGYRSQSSTTLHFGLGTESVVESLEILWPNRPALLLKNPAPNRYHTVSAPDGNE